MVVKGLLIDSAFFLVAKMSKSAIITMTSLVAN